MKILVAGGAGFVGTLLTKELQTRNHHVDVVDLCWFGNYLPESVSVNKKNILDLTAEEIQPYDCVVFIAGLSNDPMANFSPSMNFVENMAAPAYLAFLSKEAGIKRFVYASTCSVYGYTANQLMDENSAVSPQYPYGISKLAAENLIMSLANSDFRPICLRKGTIGGYSPRMRFDLVVNTMLKSALSSGKIVVNNPSIWRPLIDIRDVVGAYIRSIESSLELFGIYNICENNYTIGRLADEIKNTLNNRGHDISLEINNVQDVRNYKVSNQKAKTELDFEARYTPKDSVEHVLDNIDSDINFEDERFYNIKVFRGKYGQ